MTETDTLPVEAWSPRARAWLDRVGITRRPTRATAAEIAAHYPGVDAPVLAAVIDFEERWGGVKIDPAREHLELGVGDLLARGIAPELATEVSPALVLVGIGVDSDIFLDARGWLWGRWNDDLGEWATSVRALVERFAAGATDPWPYTLAGDPATPELAARFGLTIDADASDATYLHAVSDRHVLRGALRGTDYQVGQATLRCRDYAALTEALECGWPCGLAQPPGMSPELIDKVHAPPTAELEATLAADSRVRVASPGGGAVHVLRDGRIVGYYLNDRGTVNELLELSATGARFRKYLTPWK